jgi:hypothetical protein
MCDYSLAGMSNRLAVPGEDLQVHRFPTGSLGLVSGRRRLREILFPSTVVAVCIPPGAQLRLYCITEQMQRQLGVSAVEEVVFTQRTANANVHRDSIRFENGKEVLLQQLKCGQRITVLRLDRDDPPRAPGSITRDCHDSPTLVQL